MKCPKCAHQWTPEAPETFLAFWQACPRKIGKGAALKAYAKAVMTVTPPVLLAGIQKYAAECRARATEEQFIVHPATWLNQERWADETGAKPSAEVRESDLDRVPAWGLHLATKIGAGQFQTWFKGAIVTHGEPVRIVVPTVLQRDHIESKFGHILEQFYGDGVRVELAE